MDRERTSVRKSINQRLLARFPDAQAIAADIDPVMLAIGRGALGTVDGRLRWIEADLASPDWLESLGETQLDAVLSTTALHWLEPEPLGRIYHDLGRLLRPGGLFLNGDHMAFGPALPTLALEPAFAPLLTERTERFAGKQRQESPPGFDVHMASVRGRQPPISRLNNLLGTYN